MEIKNIVAKLHNHKEFQAWKEKNHDSYLAHLFKMIDDLNKDIWQIGYYNKNNTITTFVFEFDNLKIIPNQEVFQKVKSKIKELKMEKVTLDIDKALEIAKEFQIKDYPNNLVSKTMAILQNIADYMVYNITYITENFNTLNIKIDAIKGNIVSSQLTPMLQFEGKAS